MPMRPAASAIACSVAALAIMAGSASSVAAQVTFQDASKALASPDADVRLAAVRALRDAGDAAAALPLAPLVADPDRSVRLEAVSAEVSLFLDDDRRRSPRAAFDAGPFVLRQQAVPIEVLTALRAGARDVDPMVSVAAMYGFGTLGTQATGAVRADLLRDVAADLTAILLAQEPELRLATIRVVGRLYGRRQGEKVVHREVGDAVVEAVNDRSDRHRAAAMQALGAMRYVPAVEALSELYAYYQRGPMAEAALDALAHIAAPQSAPLFQAAITGANLTLKRIGVEGLARLGDRAYDAEVRAAVRTERSQAMLLAGSFAELLIGAGSLDGIVNGLSRADVREQAMGYLLEIAPGRAGLFGRYTLDPEPRVRIGVADALGVSGDLSAMSIVEAMRRDVDPAVVRAAERALARLRADTR